MGETADVLVVGKWAFIYARIPSHEKLEAGNYGTGRRSGGVSTLICAVFDDRRDDDDDDPKSVCSLLMKTISSAPPRYSTFIRIGSGLSYADYVWIREKPWKAWNAQQEPSFLLTAKRSHEDKGDMFLEPEEFVLHWSRSPVCFADMECTVRLSWKWKQQRLFPAVRHSICFMNMFTWISRDLDQYHIGFTMRFPRALAIRENSTVADCMTATGRSLIQIIRKQVWHMEWKMSWRA